MPHVLIIMYSLVNYSTGQVYHVQLSWGLKLREKFQPSYAVNSFNFTGHDYESFPAEWCVMEMYTEHVDRQNHTNLVQWFDSV
jgi:hypothetical protein